MRAAVYERCGPAQEVLHIADVPDPVPGPGQVLVDVAVSGVNPHDTKKRAGWLTRSLPAPRVIPHSDGAGTIVEVGPGVDRARVGERVWLMRCDAAYPGSGAAAERVVVASEHAAPLPDGVPFEVGACLAVPAMTAHRAVFAEGPVTGQTILVTGGAGAVASYAIQMAVWNGARVIATVSSAEKAAHAQASGAALCIHYPSEDVVSAVMEATRGQGVDRIIEVDFGANLDTCHKVLKPNGIIAAYSSSRVREPTLPYYAFAMRGASLHFVQGLLLTPPQRAAAVRDITVLLERGVLRHTIAARFPLDRIADAHDLAESGQRIGKVIVHS